MALRQLTTIPRLPGRHRHVGIRSPMYPSFVSRAIFPVRSYANSRSDSDRKLKYAVFGLGRMGARHAKNVAFHSPRSELVAVVDPRPETLEWAKENLPSNVELYSDAEECLAGSSAEAVLIASMTHAHAPNTLSALKAGKHVLVEKPISIDLETSRAVVEACEGHPDQKVMVGFSRRFDESYREAKRMVDAGQLGPVHLLKSATNDLYDSTGFFVAYSKHSGGIWIDCGIHDIDLARWFITASDTSQFPNPKRPVHRVFAMGQNVRHPELVKDQDVDNTTAMVEFSNGVILNFHLSRTTMHGHECSTEIFGTEGRVIVNGNPSLDRTEIRDINGVRTLSTPTYYERFKDAFVTEVNEFTSCVLDNKPVPIQARDALEATKIAMALTASYRNGVPVFFDDEGEIIMPQ